MYRRFVAKSKKPPDPTNDRYKRYLTSYKCVKTSLKSITRNNRTIREIESIVTTMNRIAIHTYQFLKLYCLHSFNKYDRLPDIDRQFIVLIMKTVAESTDKRGKGLSEDSQKIKDELDDFYKNHYQKLTVEQKLSYTNLGQSLEYEAVSILTCLNNHIQEQFESMVNRYINLLDQEFFGTIDPTKEYKSELYRLKRDILLEESKADSKFVLIKREFKDRILKGLQINKSLLYMANSTPIDLLILCIRMSLDGERISRQNQSEDDKGKLFKVINCFPLRKNIRPKYVDIDTSIIISRLMTDQKGYYSTKGNKIKLSGVIWNKFFKIDSRVFRKAGYTFNRRICTDGVGCTISLIRNDLYRDDKKSTVRTIKKPKNYKDDPYIDDLPEDHLKKLKWKKAIGIDPGLSDIIFCTDGRVEIVEKSNGKTYRKTRTFSYSTAQRKADMKTKIYANKIDKDKKNVSFHGKTVKDIESLLSHINSSSCQWNTVVLYIQIKNLINNILMTYYEQLMFRKLNWYSFINKQRSEAEMMNRFQKVFGDPKDTVILMGDFSRKSCMKYCEPTKGKSIRKLFKNRGYELYLVNEYLTSARLYETGEELSYIRKNRDGRYVHRLLGSKILKRSIARENMGLSKDPLLVDLMECGYRPTFINRDLNGSLNIRLKGWCVINGFDTPAYMKRSTNDSIECTDKCATKRTLRVTKKPKHKKCSVRQAECSAKVIGTE